MTKLKPFVVSLISRSIQEKIVMATSKEEAQSIADNTEWMEKEEMLDSEYEVRPAVISGDEKKGKHPDFHPTNYVFTKDSTIPVRYSELKNRVI